jgi:hypothetical protein
MYDGRWARAGRFTAERLASEAVAGVAAAEKNGGWSSDGDS